MLNFPQNSTKEKYINEVTDEIFCDEKNLTKLQIRCLAEAIVNTLEYQLQKGKSVSAKIADIEENIVERVWQDKMLSRIGMKYGDLYLYKIGHEASANRALEAHNPKVAPPNEHLKKYFCDLQKTIFGKCVREIFAANQHEAQAETAEKENSSSNSSKQPSPTPSSASIAGHHNSKKSRTGD